ncbi:MAG: hypothetical protein PHE51_12175 [Eubacteriales bacterium]|nr:hypothetical protein [Eubacteriales bacterium]
MLYEKLSSEEIDAIAQRIRSYGAASDYNCDADFYSGELNMPHILRVWNEQKDHYLAKLFNGELILSKHVSVTKTTEMMMEELDSAVCGWGCPESKFMSAAHELMYSNIWDSFISDKFRQLINTKNIVKNYYDGETFELPLPNGKALKIIHGCKIMKQLSKIAAAYNLPRFEEFRIAHSMVLNQRNLTGELCLSIHPLDYITMSDNDCGWDSCMSWEQNGDYRMGTVEMMNSPCVVVAYLKSEHDFDVSGIQWNSKKWRELFVVTKDVIVGILGYPYHNDGLVDECIGWLKNLAQNAGLGEYCDDIYTIEQNRKVFVKELNNSVRFDFNTNCMYNDFRDEHRCYISKTAEEYTEICYSGPTECMFCGDLIKYSHDDNMLICDECDESERCDCCGNRCSGDYRVVLEGGEIVCRDCYDEHCCECALTGEIMPYHNMTPIYLASAKDKVSKNAPNIQVNSDLIESDDFQKMFGKPYILVSEHLYWAPTKYVLYEECTEAGLEKFDTCSENDRAWFTANF